MHGFYRVAAASPEVRVADVDFNSRKIKALISKANKNSVALLVFPELSITAYTCGDLFHQSALIGKSLSAAAEIANFAKDMNMAIILGAPVCHKNRLYNCGVVVNRGKVLGVIPKSFNPNYREFYEKRWFSSGEKIFRSETDFNGITVPFGTNLIFEYDEFFRFGVEICEDLWNVIPPSSYHALAGANVIANLSASNELVSKSEYRKELVKQQSARCIAAYVYASAGVWESTTDLVFGGHALIAENGIILAENERFLRKSSMISADIDCQRLHSTRISASSFGDNSIPENYAAVKLGRIGRPDSVNRKVEMLPFVPPDPEMRGTRCGEIFSIQSAGLAKRMEHTKLKKAVIGISGGLDSTLALLVTKEAFRLTGRKNSDIIAVTMPGFGTGRRTFQNAVRLCKILGADFREIKINEACKKHFRDIGHNPKVHDITYENVQSRERTQILMDIANGENGLVVGTGDLSEIALGWSTYNGDHMSMYAVNCGVPKTLIRYLVGWVADNSGGQLKKVLRSIIDTPVTPELLPKGRGGKIIQKTEEIIGPYELHDFFLYHTVRYGASPGKTAYLADIAFKNKYSKSEIRKYLGIFISRFFSQQFKRNCIPDGPKVGTISLSPRGDWRMPLDASCSSILKTNCKTRSRHDENEPMA